MQVYYKSKRFQEVEALILQANRHMKVASLSALCTRRLHPPGNISGTHFCYRQNRPQSQSVTGIIMSVTPLGIKPATFRFVAQCLYQMRHRVHP
jgi:hypothetical protein